MCLKTLEVKDTKWREKDKEKGQSISTADNTCSLSADALPSEGKGQRCDWQEVTTRKSDNKTLIMTHIITIRQTYTHTDTQTHLQVSTQAKWCRPIARVPCFCPSEDSGFPSVLKGQQYRVKLNPNIFRLNPFQSDIGRRRETVGAPVESEEETACVFLLCRGDDEWRVFVGNQVALVLWIVDSHLQVHEQKVTSLLRGQSFHWKPLWSFW